MFLGGMLALGSACLGFVLGMLGLTAVGGLLPDGPHVLAYLPFIGAGVFAATALLYTALSITFTLRLDAWLEGTRLTVRGIRERSVDLATARSVSLQQTNHRLVGPRPLGGPVAPSPYVAELVVVGADGETARLRLASREGVQLPPQQLLLLADTLSVARCPGVSPAVGWLRGTAASALG